MCYLLATKCDGICVATALHLNDTCFRLGAQGTEAINGLVTSITVPANKDNGKYSINFQRITPGSKTGVKDTMEVDYIIGSDGANSRVAKVGAARRLARFGSSSNPIFGDAHLLSVHYIIRYLQALNVRL